MQMLFQDPDLLKATRTEVIPRLRTYPTPRAWVPACGTGEDAISLAILLREEGLGRTAIYATDDDCAALLLARAKDRVNLPLSAERYKASGGRSSLSEYFVESECTTSIRPALLSNIHFAQHDLSTDASVNEFQLVLMGPRFLEFPEGIKRRALRIVDESLCRFGCLGVADRELLRHLPEPKAYCEVNWGDRIYKKLR